jgi:hypothetical protein
VSAGSPPFEQAVAMRLVTRTAATPTATAPVTPRRPPSRRRRDRATATSAAPTAARTSPISTSVSVAFEPVWGRLPWAWAREVVVDAVVVVGAGVGAAGEATGVNESPVGSAMPSGASTASTKKRLVRRVASRCRTAATSPKTPS